MDVHFIVARQILGGPGRGQVRRMLRHRHTQLARIRTWLSQARERVAAARQKTERLAAKLMR